MIPKLYKKIGKNLLSMWKNLKKKNKKSKIENLYFKVYKKKTLFRQNSKKFK